MGLINDDRVITAEHGVKLRLREQNSIRHELDSRLRATAVLKPHLIPHPLPER